MVKTWKEYNRLPQKALTKLTELNDLSGSEWSRLSKSINTYNGTIAAKRKTHGAAYPATLAKHIIQIFTKVGDTVLDPFVGVGTTTDVAQMLGRNSIGLDINPDFINHAKKGIDPVDRHIGDFTGEVTTQLLCESCEDIRKFVNPNSIDLTVTSPPYSSLLNNTIKTFGGSDYEGNIYKNSKRTLAKPYSTHNRDLGNMNWENYCDVVKHLMSDLYYVSKEGSYNVWVVRDYRDMPSGIPYVNLHGKIVELACSQGWILTDIIIWDQTQQRHLVKQGGKKTRRFYFNIGHSYIVIFRKNIGGESFVNGY